MEFSFLDPDNLMSGSHSHTESMTNSAALSYDKDQMDILGDTSDFDIIDLRTAKDDKNVSTQGPTNATDQAEADLLFMNASKETNPFLNDQGTSKVQESPAERLAVSTKNSMDESSDTHQQNLFNSKERKVMEEECVAVVNTNVTGGEISIPPKDDIHDLTTEWDIFDISDNIAASADEKSSTALPTLISCVADSGNIIDATKDNTVDSLIMQARPRRVKSEKSSNSSVNKNSKTKRNTDLRNTTHEKEKGKVTFGSVHRSYYSDLGMSNIEVDFGNEVLLYKKYIKMQEEQASSLRKIVKLEKQLEEALSKKSELQSELLESDRKLSKLETRESAYVEKEKKFHVVVNKYRNEANKCKEEAVNNERKAARLERLLDELDDRRKKDQYELDNAKKNVSDLETRFRNIEKDLESNQSVNLRNMRELSGSTAKLEREREENAELRLAIERLQDKLRNSEEIANRAMREKAIIQGELSELRSNLENWKTDSKLGKVKYDEALALSDRYRKQYQEQKDVLENVMKSRRQLENELHETMILVQKREAQNKAKLQRINELEDVLYNLKKEEEQMNYKRMLELELKRKILGNHHWEKEGLKENTSERVFSTDTRVDNLLVLNDELRAKTLTLEEENRVLKLDLHSIKLKHTELSGKIELHEQEKGVLEKVRKLHNAEKESMQREITELKGYINHLIDLKSRGPPSSIGNREDFLDRTFPSRSQSEAGYYHSNPDLLNTTYTKHAAEQPSRRYSSIVERVSSMPDLHLDFDSDNITYTGYQRDRGRRNTYRVTDYPSRERNKEGDLGWRSSPYTKSKYSTSQKPGGYYNTSNLWRRESKDGSHSTMLDRTSYTGQYESSGYNQIPRGRSVSPSLDRASKIEEEEEAPNLLRPSTISKDSVSVLATSSLKGSSSTGDTVVDTGIQGRASVTFKDDDEVFTTRSSTTSKETLANRDDNPKLSGRKS